MSTRIPPVKTSRYERPRGLAALVFGGALFSYICWAGVALVPEESSIWQIFDNISPGTTESFRWIVKTGVPPLMMIHTVEAVAFDLTRLIPYGVPRWGLLWWKWIITCWIEGFTCWKRFASVNTTKKSH
ncbi:hypothetical protein F53441_5030 [Fusarium austroafricanum]|uniref:Uncharacterized protein n=1 Tax=Fusarium austroafricanum TaxID=2364996 RepID=A0A8H4KKQ4_9HYPO|nr:hypothetical protein F53441_5030 [Fusarium austroafricanum]